MLRNFTLIAALIFTLSACGSGTLDRSNPNTVANKLVKSYQDRDIETFASLMPSNWADEARDLRVNGKESDTYKILYDPEQVFIYMSEAPSKLPPPRWDDYEDCLLYNVATTTHGRFAVLCMSKTSEGAWAMEDMYYKDPEDYEKLPKPTSEQL